MEDLGCVKSIVQSNANVDRRNQQNSRECITLCYKLKSENLVYDEYKHANLVFPNSKKALDRAGDNIRHKSWHVYVA